MFDRTKCDCGAVKLPNQVVCDDCQSKAPAVIKMFLKSKVGDERQNAEYALKRFAAHKHALVGSG